MNQKARSIGVVCILLIAILLTGCGAAATTQAPTATQGTTFTFRTPRATTASGPEASVTPPAALTTSTPANPTPGATLAATAASTGQIPTSPVYPTPTLDAVGKITLPAQAQGLSLGQNAATTVITVDQMTNGVYKAYQFQAAAGQIIHLVANGRLTLQVIGPDQAPLSPIVAMPGTLHVAAAKSGMYTLGLTGLGDATIGLYLTPAGSNAPTPAQIQTVEIPANPLSVSFPSKGDPSAPAGYAFEAKAGQTLTLQLTGNVVPFVVAPDGNTVVPETDAVTRQWKFFLPESGKTTLVLLGAGPISVTARVDMVQSAAVLPANPAKGATPLWIQPGNSMVRLDTVFVENQPQSYVVHLKANQLLTVSATGACGVSKFSGPGGSEIALTHSMYSTNWSIPIAQEGDYTITLSGIGPSTLQFSIP